MPDYQELYFKLFAAVANNYGLARERLIAAQQETEEQYISEE